MWSKSRVSPGGGWANPRSVASTDASLVARHPTSAPQDGTLLRPERWVSGVGCAIYGTDRMAAPPVPHTGQPPGRALIRPYTGRYP